LSDTREFDVSRIVIVYNWASEYPPLAYPETSGSVAGAFRARSPADLLRSSEAGKVIVFVAGNGYDAELTYQEALSPSIARHVVAFLYNGDVFTSLSALRANYSLVSGARHRGDDYVSVFSPSHASRYLQRVVDVALTEQRHFSQYAFLIAPFGPKPLTVAAFLAWARFHRFSTGPTVRISSDIVLETGARYASVYSVGWRSMTAYDVDVVDSHGSGPALGTAVP
jgi:hypothetical protein